MIRYKKLGYVAFDVSDVEKTSKFYEEMVGLKLEERVENGPAFLRCSRDHHNIVLYPSKEPGVKRIGLEVEDPVQLNIAFEYLTNQGLNPVDVEETELKQLRQGRTFRIQDPYAGIIFEFYSDMVQVATDYNPLITNIARLGHVNFMVSDMDDIGKSMNRMKKNDIPIVYGPGRHDPSGSVFLYFLDPDEITVEFSFGMEEFAEVGARKARLLDMDHRIADIWGSIPDPRMGAVGKIKN